MKRRFCSTVLDDVAAISHKEQSVKLALINSYSITVHQFSDLVCQHFFKLELELLLLASHLFFSED